jgi:hypothetical protein
LRTEDPLIPASSGTRDLSIERSTALQLSNHTQTRNAGPSASPETEATEKPRSAANDGTTFEGDLIDDAYIKISHKCKVQSVAKSCNVFNGDIGSHHILVARTHFYEGKSVEEMSSIYNGNIGWRRF